MRHITKIILAGILTSASPLFTQAKQWSLQDCISYAIKNNITIQKAQLTKQSAYEDYLQSKAALLPSLSASTSQNINYTPWVASGISSDGYTRSSIDKTSYNGIYSVSGNWTIWNGNRNRNQIKLNKLTVEAAELDSAIQAQNIEEQIVQLYIQILYSNEAIEVNKESLRTSQLNEERGKTMLNVGKISKADLAQLTAQRAQDEYNIVSAENNVKNYKRQLKALLQITNDDNFDITIPTTTDEMAMAEIPALNDVYNSALNNRPEIKNYLNHIKQSDLNIKIAKANKLPTVSATAGISTSTTSMNNNPWGTQLKDNFSVGGGISVSIPISDNRNSKTIINKALIQKENYILDLKNQQTTLYSTIENYWLQANTNQSQFKAAKLNTESAQKSYELLNEQFNLGLKNIIELRTGKDKYIMAKQNELQAKYMTILNHDMLKFYQNGIIK
ncbi:TolC family protein [Segatella albensis]|uniref:TolC family protein n=1 Tax=Segatella albensis TaxID=77768 RepID=UPI0003FB3B21|nr:TolC family protein [Segatella albensis]